MLRAGCSDTPGAFFFVLHLLFCEVVSMQHPLFHEHEVYCKNQE